MYNIGDLIIYSGHGICKVDNICDKTYFGNIKTYYVLQPLENSHQLTISIPVDNEKVNMSRLIQRNQAEEILESFKSLGVNWIENNHLRIQVYNDIVKTGNRNDIAKVANTLIRKKHELEMEEKKFGEQDKHLLISIQNILFKELAISLNTTYDAVVKEVNRLIEKNE
ncbi:CarD family transcriptional regulator [Bacillus sp. EB600]|nr:CarD family transcriptional regulator [Bacillus sp. EB600]